MSTERRIFCVVDRFEGDLAVVVADDGRVWDVPRTKLPVGASEGSVLAVSDEPAPRWETAMVDEAERARRLDEARRLRDRLKRRDPGGNIEL